jgi:LDH2 family malate/lactate/ureidoglycolate dehydrogenase
MIDDPLENMAVDMSGPTVTKFRPPQAEPEDVAPHDSLIDPASRIKTKNEDQILLDASMIERILAARLVSQLGFSEEAACVTVKHLIAAEQAGRDCHGLIRLKPLFDGAFDFSSRRRPVPDVISSSLVTFDGSGVPGYYVVATMLETAIELAEKSGVCFAVGRNIYPSGYLGLYGRIAAEAGFLAHIEATSPSRVTAPGGAKPYLGTNPICRAYPLENQMPVVIDLATSAITHGDLLLAQATGAELPQHTAVRKDRSPARFVQDFDPSKGEGALLPFGGAHAYKAFALAMGVALQTSYGGSPPAAAGGGAFGLSILLIDIGRLGRTHDAERAAWVSSLSENESVRIPGWNSIACARAWEARGLVPVARETWHMIRPYLSLGETR